MFVLAYLWTMFWRALSATGKADMILALLLAVVTILGGPWLNADIGLAQWLAVALLVWFLLEFLIISPARAWHEMRGPSSNPVIRFEAGSIQTGATVIVQAVQPSSLSSADRDLGDTQTVGPPQVRTRNE